MDDQEDQGVRVMGLRFSPDIRLGEIVVALGVIGGGMLWWGDVNAQFTMLKAGQAAQVETNVRIEGNIREIKNEVKDTKESVHGLERRMDRARM